MDYRERAPRLVALAVALLLLWAGWVQLVARYPGLASPGWAIVARVLLWGGPSLVYLLSVRPQPLLRPLGLGFPYGKRQLINVALVPFVVATILVIGTSHRMGVSAFELLELLREQARPRLVAPVCEELVFRGVLVSEAVTIVRETTGQLARLRRRFWGVQLACAAVFTLIHWPFWLREGGLSQTLDSSLPLLMTGLVLGVIFVSTRSVWACILLHWLNNELSRIQL